MGKYIIRRLLQMIPVLIGTTLLIFLLVYALPGDPLAGRCGERECPEAYKAEFRRIHNLDKPLWLQYVLYLGNLLRGNLGTSFYASKPVAQLLIERYPTTVLLACMAIAFQILIGISAGIIAGITKGGKLAFIDHIVTLCTLVIVSIPVFVIGSLAQMVIGVQWRLLPVTARGGTPYELIMPAIVLGSLSMAYVARLMRTNLVENLRSDYVRTAKAKGLSWGRTVGIHTLRNSLVPVITFIGYEFGGMLGGAIVTERIFNINGIGFLLFESIRQKDGDTVVGTVTILVLAYLLVNLFVDVLYGVLDPRISND